MLIAGDLISDVDILALDANALTHFGTANATLRDKRLAAVEGWLAPRLEQAQFDVYRVQVRHVPDAVFKYVGAAYTDLTADASDATEDDIDLADIFATPASDALFIGYRDPFRGAFFGMLDSVNTQAAVTSMTYWNGGKWASLSSVVDDTEVTSGKAFSGGGRMTWRAPDDWTRRLVNDASYYWARLTMSSTLSQNSAVGQILPIQRSRLTTPLVYHTLGLLYQEGWVHTRGDWQEKAAKFLERADTELEIALTLLSKEIDVDDNQAVARAEASSVMAPSYLYTLERG